MKKEPLPFEALPIKRKAIPSEQKAGYRVYSDSANYKIVQAETAKAAIEQSGIARPYKVERQETVIPAIISEGNLKDVLDEIEVVDGPPLSKETVESEPEIASASEVEPTADPS